jgi:hypothetical protein
MNPALGRFQDEFAAAIFGDTGFAPAAQRGFHVYRNGVITACIEALRTNFPAVERLTGKEWFRDAAGLYARRYPPRAASLLRYGEHMPQFLHGLASLDSMPWLADVARLELLWTECWSAAAEAALDASRLAQQPPHVVGALRLRPHATARWAWFAAPVHSIWDANRRGLASPRSLAWAGEGTLLVRRADSVEVTLIDRQDCAFLDACHEGCALAEAATRFGPADDVAARFATLLAAGAFAVPRE